MRGFTLIEISIVLIIIGLITSGIIVGQDLIEAAKLRHVVTESERYKTAANAFLLKYNCLPGDCINAHDFFGDACGDNSSDEQRGCNGNGDGVILHLDYETFKAWHHLSYAGLIPAVVGAYNQADVPITKNGVNTPVSAWSSQATWHWSTGDNVGMGWAYPEHVIGFVATTDHDFALVISGPQAFRLDSKYDDGKPASGTIHANIGTGCDDGANNYITSSGGTILCQLGWGKAY